MQLQFTEQKYQEECIRNIISIFNDLKEGFGFEYALNQCIKQEKISNSKNIDILMETGTGKTFTYIKTMFELNHNFGYNKFIILVPSLAIREGTKKNFEITKDYFKSIYSNFREREIDVNIYDGSISVINRFLDDDNFSVLVLTPHSFTNKENKLNRTIETEGFFSNKRIGTYLDALKELNPIIIIDEPHKFAGEAFSKYFNGFNNYFLRFGATFPKSKDKKDHIIELSNIAYKLDGVSSFKKNLVKKITVYYNETYNNKDIILSIEKDIVKIKSNINSEIVYKDLKVGDKFNGEEIIKINYEKKYSKESNIILSDGEQYFAEYLLEEDNIRFMIKESIELHFEKEKKLFLKGIKALSLFFIRYIAEYRRDLEDAEKYIDVKKIFEEEYKIIREKIINEIKNKEEYREYLKYLENDYKDGQLKVHEGYFSGDKGNDDEKIRKGVDLILKSKEKLLSFETQTRFIFSVWALQEGWDNPNVFTICKLSNRGSHTSKIQQVGRGLRICVNQKGERLTIDTFKDKNSFWNINNLDVVVSGDEADFIESLQKEIVDNSSVLYNEFTRTDLNSRLKANNIETNIRKFEKFLLDYNLIIDLEKVDDKGLDIYKKADDYFNKLSELKNKITDKEEKLMLEYAYKIFDEDMEHYITNGNKLRERKNLKIKNEKIEDFKKLWDFISKEAYYYINELNEKNEEILLNSIIEKINKLDIGKKSLKTVKLIWDIDNLEKDNSINKEILSSHEYRENIDYVFLARELAEKSKMPISFIVKILNGINKELREKIESNINYAKAEILYIIKNALIGDMKTLIEYNFIDGKIKPNIMYDKKGNFKNELEAGSLGKNQEKADNFSLKEEWIFEDIIEYDSIFERSIILDDPKINSIKIFAKMPKLSIPTPLGNYSPDFCYAVEREDSKKIFLIVESKGYNTEEEIPADEKSKIDFAYRFFEKINKNNSNDVKVYYKKRINKSQLYDMIEEVIKND
ncbi:DEAD/DEAH box helicase family protein [Brachyspira hyodysenteriae]|uniref:restriction endonuclease n=1 Tax=Brachyspira hyodysenteriae TaxID=159 RepID=UPI00063DD986|nr:DEAD/DEAH box helicase family protein [Brachyspira hyodysenteriae]KLI19666.1 hypothetical protein SU46_06150 [Brachyspira hyodysenteriae]KLI30127.1 hypothetical protein SZ49_07550 [Brachyspira hyodysenteriae]KLI37109.1 hypothetical protein SZ51_10735 [Brachyspira hyodysenteriae]KLI57827.1 hypothetical protein SZ44_12100 [Brachyspira hyodysenteriae]